MEFLLSIRDNYKKGAFIALAVISLFFTPAVSLFLGLAFSLLFENPYSKESKQLSKKLLQYSVIGLGFGMNLYSSLESGKEGMTFTIVSVISIMILGYVLGRVLKLNTNISYLVSSGTAICGGSAIAAVAPLTKSSEGDISVALASIFILNAIALFIFPPIGHYFNMTQQQFGTWAAMAIHDTSSVVGAGAIYGEEALKVATTVKLTRALWIIPLALVTPLFFKNNNSKVNIPWFIFFFILAMVANTFLSLPEVLTTNIVWLSKKLLVLTLFLIGSGLSKKTLQTVGFKPMVLGVLLWAFIGIISFVVIMLEV